MSRKATMAILFPSLTVIALALFVCWLGGWLPRLTEPFWAFRVLLLAMGVGYCWMRGTLLYLMYLDVGESIRQGETRWPWLRQLEMQKRLFRAIPKALWMAMGRRKHSSYRMGQHS